MARTDNLKNYLTDVASAIKEVEGSSETIPANTFDERIKNLKNIIGGDSTIITKDNVEKYFEITNTNTSSYTDWGFSWDYFYYLLTFSNYRKNQSSPVGGNYLHTYTLKAKENIKNVSIISLSPLINQTLSSTGFNGKPTINSKSISGPFEIKNMELLKDNSIRFNISFYNYDTQAYSLKQFPIFFLLAAGEKKIDDTVFYYGDPNLPEGPSIESTPEKQETL